MATDTPSDRFEDIDWEEIDAQSGTLLSGKPLYTVIALAVMSSWFLYDYQILTEREPTVPYLGWDFTQVDWMFLGAFVLFCIYGLYPLYKNPRMTGFYWKEFKKNRASVVSLIFLMITFMVGTIVPAFLEQPTVDLLEQLQPPVYFSIEQYYPLQCMGEVVNQRCYGTWAHPFGTTSRGKDVLKFIIYGMQISMKIAFTTWIMVMTLGTLVGTTAAYIGGITDEILMRYVDIQLTFPEFLLYLLLLYMFGASLFMFIIVFGLFSWGGIARLVRSEALQRREEEYVTAAASSGASSSYVIWRHIVPNVSNTVITAATLLIPGFLLFEAGLAFIGLGNPSLPSWGQVIAEGRNHLTYAWWISTIPGFFLFLTILAFNFLGEGLSDALDPRSEHK